MTTKEDLAQELAQEMEKVLVYINKFQLNTKSRKRELAYPRAYLMAYMRELFGISYEQIGDFFKRDHATVIYAINDVHERFKDDSVYLELCSDVVRMFPFENINRFIDVRKANLLPKEEHRVTVIVKGSAVDRMRVVKLAYDLATDSDAVNYILNNFKY